ncbi:MAG: CubicO group peptidase (beta-lactamase class C family) [Ilumatobacter sp.]|jgi:CubicO group peptidase (beta-lactamase class C family)
MTRALDIVSEFPVPTAAAAVLVSGSVVDTCGPVDHRFHLASLAKTVTSWAVLVAVEEGTVSLDDDIDGATLEQLLSHAGGHGFDATARRTEPGLRRIYSNPGIEAAAQHVTDRSSMPFVEYLQAGVLDPLKMGSTRLSGSPAHGMWSTVNDMGHFLTEVSTPTLISPAMAANAARSHFPALGGIVPGVGRFDTCPWGLGFEVRGDKYPHWTGPRNSAATFGHFGGAGTMMWVDPERDLSLVALSDRSFDEWATDALILWPKLSDAVIDEFVGVV